MVYQKCYHCVNAVSDIPCNSMNITQCKMARAGLGLRAADVAEAAGLQRITVSRFESGGRIDQKSLAAIQAALEQAGAQFNSGPGYVGVNVPE